MSDATFQTEFEQLAQASEHGESAIGLVITSTGTVTVERADGTTDQLGAGDRVYEDDVILTSDDSTVGIRFADDSRFSLGEDGKMQLDEFVYDASAGTGSSLVDVAHGTFAFVSGMIAKTGDDAMSVNTPVATIGVRGTTVAGDVGRDGETEITLLPDTDGTLGEIAVFNDAGLQIMFDAFQRLDVGADRAPSSPRTIEPSEIRDGVADTVRAIGADPTGGSGTREESAPESDPGADEDAAIEGEVQQAAVDPTELPQAPAGIQDMAADPNDAVVAQAPMDAPVEKVEANGDMLVITLADGTVFEVPAEAAEAGTVSAPNGQSIDLTGFAVSNDESDQTALLEEQEEDKSEFREETGTLENAAAFDGNLEAAGAKAAEADVLNFTPDALVAASGLDGDTAAGDAATFNAPSRENSAVTDSISRADTDTSAPLNGPAATFALGSALDAFRTLSGAELDNQPTQAGAFEEHFDGSPIENDTTLALGQVDTSQLQEEQDIAAGAVDAAGLDALPQALQIVGAADLNLSVDDLLNAPEIKGLEEPDSTTAAAGSGATTSIADGATTLILGSGIDLNPAGSEPDSIV